jgi:glutathione S-transferase
VISEVLAIWHYFEEVHPTPPLLGVTPKEKTLIVMWERRTETEGFASVMEGVRNAIPGLRGRAIAGPHDYDQIPAIVDRSKLRLKNFYADLDVRLTEASFVAGDQFSAADITAVVTVDFAIKAMDFPLSERYRSLKRWYDVVSNRPSATV